MFVAKTLHVVLAYLGYYNNDYIKCMQLIANGMHDNNLEKCVYLYINYSCSVSFCIRSVLVHLM